jgi:16S rRNA processing protein RimM
MFSDYFFLGKISKPVGLRGEMSIWLDVDEPSVYDGTSTAFLNINGSLVPYFFEKFEVKTNSTNAIARFADFNADEILALIGKDVYLPLTKLPKLEGNKFYFHEVVDFQVVDRNSGNIGNIESIIDNGPQAIFQIKHSSGKEILIPVIDDFIEKLDRTEKIFYLNAPEGLVEFYLS